MKKIEINHFLDFKFPSAPTFSPDGKTIAFVVRQASLEKMHIPVTSGCWMWRPKRSAS